MTNNELPEGFPANWADLLHRHVRDAAQGYYDERTEHARAAVELVSTWLGDDQQSEVDTLEEMMSHREPSTSSVAELVFVGLCLLVILAVIVGTIVWFVP